MFDKNQNQNFAKDLSEIELKENTLNPAVEKNGLPTTEKKNDPINIRTHVMPDKFLSLGRKAIVQSSSGAGTTTSGLKKNIIIGIIIGVLVITLLALASWFLIKSLETPPTIEPNSNQPIVNPEVENQPLVPTTTPTSTAETLGCSADNCEFCGEEECQQLNEFCHWADLCQESTQATSSESCPIFQCFVGPTKQIKNEEDLEEAPLSPGKDSDNDFLTDTEEGLWGTDPLNSDTDEDNYVDGDEIKNLYSPLVKAGVAKNKLADSQLIKLYTNNQFGYTLFYPASWQENALAENDNAIMFTSQSGEFFEVIVEANTDNFATAKEWYLDQNSNLSADELSEVLIGNWSGVRSLDNLSFYLIKDNYLYTLTYNVGLKNELSYQTTFEMFLKSFHLFQSP